MKIKLNRAAIQAALKRVVSAVPATSTLEIMTHLAVQVSGGLATWTGGRADVQVSVTTPVDADGDGQFTVPAKKFSVLLNGMTSNTEVTLDVGRDETIMRAGRSRYTLAGLDPTMYPRQTVKPKFSVDLAAATFAEMLAYVQPCMNTGQDPMLFTMATMVVFTGRRIDVVTTDKHRMGYASADIETDSGRALIHRDGVPLVMSVLSAGEVATLGVDDRKFSLVVGDYELIGSQVDGSQFDYERLMQERDYVRLPAGELRAAVGRMIGFADQNGRCEIDMTATEMRLRAGVRGEADEVIGVESGRDVTLRLSIGQVKDVLDVSTGDEISIGIGAAGEPVTWREAADSRRLTIMTQIRT